MAAREREQSISITCALAVKRGPRTQAQEQMTLFSITILKISCGLLWGILHIQLSLC